MRMKSKWLWMVLATVAGGTHAAVVIRDFSTSYTQNFNSLPSPAAGEQLTWANNSTLAGWYQAHSSPVATGEWSYAVVPSTTVEGNVASGGWGSQASIRFANIGHSNSTDRAIGMARNFSADGAMGAIFQNDSGKAMTGFSLGYTGEQWRRGGADQTALYFEYQVLSTDAGFNVNSATSTWIRVSALQFNSIVAGSNADQDGKANNRRSVIAPVTVDVNVADGQFLAVRWYQDRTKIDGTASTTYHGLAIDDVSFQAIPESVMGSVKSLSLICIH